MALHFITGKPGSGKSFEAVKRLVQMLGDWCRFESKKGKPFARICFTNLPINKDGVDEYFSDRNFSLSLNDFGFERTPSDYIQLFEASGKWWEDIPAGALVILDEAHESLGREETIDTDFRNYLAQHRHCQHDLIMITQDLDNVNVQTKGIAESIEDVQNFKTGLLPYINIPLRDVLTVLRSWGIHRQFYTLSKGRLVGKNIKWGGAQTHSITPDLFTVYNSHSAGVFDNKETGLSSDEPDLELSRIGSLLWFARRHAWRFLLIVGIVAGGIFGAIYGVKTAPVFLSSLVSSSMSISSPDGKKHKVGEPKEPPVFVSDGKLLPLDKAAGSHSKTEAMALLLEQQGQLLKAQDEQIEELKKEVEKLKEGFMVAAIYSGGIVLKNNLRVQVGDDLNYNGQDEKLEAVNPATGTILFSSGRKAFLR